MHSSARSSWVGGSLVILGLAGLAITQPVLDLLGRHPQLFVAGRYRPGQIIALAVLVAVVPAAVLIGAVALARWAHPRAGAVVEGIAVALLGALFGAVVTRGLDLERDLLVLMAAGAGALLALVLARGRAGRMLLQYLAIANVLFLVSFLAISPTSDLLGGAAGAEDLGDVSVPPLPGPVLVIVFDELPLSTIIRSDGTINADRYPAFARLAASSTWYRNASSPHHETDRAVPAVLTGRVHERLELPTYQAQPRNLFSLLGRVAPVERYEGFTDMCPPTACGRQTASPFRQALEDTATIYGHRVLPTSLRDRLPAIDESWGAFGDTADAAAPAPNPLHRYRDLPASERAATTQAARLLEQATAVDGRPMLHFAHVVFPHLPWTATPWGTTLMGPMPDWIVDPNLRGFEESALLRYQLHSLQVGAADVALGEVLDHLEETGVWDDTTLVVVADHGTATIPPDLGRAPTADNLDEIYRVPLFVKAPGETSGAVVDEPALTIDVLPTLIDLLDIETDWELDGHSLADGSTRALEPLVDTDIAPLLAVARRHEADFPHGDDWMALAALGPHGGLVGRPLAELEVGAPSAISWDPLNDDTFASLPSEQGEVPQLVVGHVDAEGTEAPPSLVVVANGTVAGVTGRYKADGERWWFNALLGPYLVDGANQIDAYEVTTAGGEPVLHLVG